MNIACHSICDSVIGPGRRLVIWMQGCCFQCDGCINPHLQTMYQNKLISIDHLTELTRNLMHEIDGVTITGGEPFLQPEALSQYTRAVKNIALPIVVYTGFTLRQLESSRSNMVKDVLKYIDVLIDGPFVRDDAVNTHYKGSANQVIHFLTNHYQMSDFDNTNRFEVCFQEGMIQLTGFYDERINLLK